jgi:hypothetical protein
MFIIIITTTGGMPQPDRQHASLSLGNAGVRALVTLLDQRALVTLLDQEYGRQVPAQPGRFREEMHIPISALPVLWRILRRLTSGNRQPRRPAAAGLAAIRVGPAARPALARPRRVAERSGRLVPELGDGLASAERR